MKAIDSARAVLLELWNFAWRPRLVVRARQQADFHGPSAWTVLAAVVGVTAVVFTLYVRLFGSLGTGNQALEFTQIPAAPATESAAAPHLAGLSVGKGVGIALLIVGTQGDRVTMEVRGGIMSMTLADVPAQGLAQGTFPFLVAGTFALLIALCLYPPARLLGAQGRFLPTFNLSLFYCAFVIALSGGWLLLASLLLTELLQLEGTARDLSMFVLVQLPILFVCGRSFMLGFSELYQLRLRRIAAAGLAGVVLAFVLAPLVLFPAVYAAVLLQPLFDLIS